MGNELKIFWQSFSMFCEHCAQIPQRIVNIIVQALFLTGLQPRWANASRAIMRVAMLAILPLSAAAQNDTKPAPVSASSHAKPVFAATIHPVGAILREVVGQRAEVRVLLSPASSPHTFAPTPSDVSRVQEALALFHVDPTLDGWATRFPVEERIALFAMLPVELRVPADGHVCAEHGHDQAHQHGDQWDTHFWTDPLVVKAILPALVEELTRLDPDGEAHYRAGADAFGASLEALHAELTAQLISVNGRAVLLFHPSLLYLMQRYGLRLGGVVEPFPGRSPSPRQLRDLIALMRRENIRTVYSEPQLSQRPAQALAAATGARLAVLDPIGGVEGRMTYAELLRFNAAVLRDTL